MNLFDKFQVETKVVKIEALDASVTLTQPTIMQNKEINGDIFTGKNSDGTPKLDYNKLFMANLNKIAMCMIEPIVEVEYLKSLSLDSNKALTQILDEIDDWDGSVRKADAEAKERELQGLEAEGNAIA